jgi:hypothetical protein
MDFLVVMKCNRCGHIVRDRIVIGKTKTEVRKMVVRCQKCNREDTQVIDLRETDQKPDFRKRRKIVHEWPPIGTILEGSRPGKKFVAEVVKCESKVGKAIKFQGKIYGSMSRAAYEATGKSTDGWIFWKVVIRKD